MECIFCRIASKAIKAQIVHETEDLVVIKDINPQAPVHLLVIPKKHYSTLPECEDKGLLGDMLLAAVKAAKDSGVGESGFRAAINTNDEGGQTVLHLHMHLLGGRPLSGRLG